MSHDACRRQADARGEDGAGALTPQLPVALSPAEEVFFDGRPRARELYAVFLHRLLELLPDAQLRIQKTQITFTNPRVFACVSMMRVRRARERPPEYIVVTFGLGHELRDRRIDAAIEVRPRRWTHHVLVADESEVDDQLMAWVEEAYEFSRSK